MDKPARAAQQRKETAHRRRRDLPEHRRPAPAVRLRAHPSPRRMARQRPPLPLRGVHGVAHPAGADRHHALEKGQQQPLSPIRHRYGIVATTRRVKRDQLHHPTGPSQWQGERGSAPAGRSLSLGGASCVRIAKRSKKDSDAEGKPTDAFDRPRDEDPALDAGQTDAVIASRLGVPRRQERVRRLPAVNRLDACVLRPP